MHTTTIMRAYKLCRQDMEWLREARCIVRGILCGGIMTGEDYFAQQYQRRKRLMQKLEKKLWMALRERTVGLDDLAERQPVWHVSLLKSAAPTRWSCVIEYAWPSWERVSAEANTPEAAIRAAVRRALQAGGEGEA